MEFETNIIVLHSYFLSLIQLLYNIKYFHQPLFFRKFTILVDGNF